MCNLCRLNIAKKDLPLPPPLNTAWLETKKIIDAFHLPNHTRSTCKELYSPADMKTKHPDFNTHAGEQTFTWISRFKHIVCAMNKPIICFTFTEWLEEEIYTQKSATQWGENLFCQKTRSLPNLHISLMNQPPLLRGGTV